jgi:E3 ubiquitin-protein ligase RGLG
MQFQFVDYNKIVSSSTAQHPDVVFALNALMELPDQYRTIRELGLS